MAIKNSYESKSLCGGTPRLNTLRDHSDNVLRLSGNSVNAEGKTLPPIVNKQLPSTQRVERGSKRHSYSPPVESSLSPMQLTAARPKSSSGHHEIYVRGRSGSAGSGDVYSTRQELLQNMRRSTSQSSVAVNHTTPTLQNGTSSYVCHRAGRSRGRCGHSTSRFLHNSSSANLNPRCTSPTDHLKRSTNYATVAGQGVNGSSSVVKKRPGDTHSMVELHRMGVRYTRDAKDSFSMVDGHSSQGSPTTAMLDYNVDTSEWLKRNSLINTHAQANRSKTPRGNNPHPVGLQYQSPYNKQGQAFEIWKPNIGTIESHYPRMFRNIEHTNFSCGKMHSYTPGRTSPPEIHYNTSSMYRRSYQSPHTFTSYDSSMPTTRFGSSPNGHPAMGIVPHVMTPRSHSAITSTSTGAARSAEKKIVLHTPRGKKISTLV